MLIEQTSQSSQEYMNQIDTQSISEIDSIEEQSLPIQTQYSRSSNIYTAELESELPALPVRVVRLLKRLKKNLPGPEQMRFRLQISTMIGNAELALFNQSTNAQCNEKIWFISPGPSTADSIDFFFFKYT